MDDAMLAVRPATIDTAQADPLEIFPETKTRVRRWTKGKKMRLLLFLEVHPELTPETIATYGISIEELDIWRRARETHGEDALKVTRLVSYRGHPE